MLESVAAAPSRIELKIPAGAEWVRVARLTVAGVASRLPFSVDDVDDIKLALSEAINNAILHASVARNAAPQVSILFEISPGGLWISVADEGHLAQPLPLENAPVIGELPESGLGMTLIRSLMDEVEQHSGPRSATVLRMFKRVPPPQPARLGARPSVAR